MFYFEMLTVHKAQTILWTGMQLQDDLWSFSLSELEGLHVHQEASISLLYDAYLQKFHPNK